MKRRWLIASVVLASPGLALGGCEENGAEGSPSGVPCADGQELCGDVCVSVAESLQHCGACDHACGTGQSCVQGACTCAAGLTDCETACANLQTDGEHCGACGNTCAAPLVCSLGECSDRCADELTQCGVSCTDLEVDVANCGACGSACAAGMLCAEGACVCSDGRSLCAGICSNLATDANHCGQCGNTCANACVNGSCVEVGAGSGGSGGSVADGGGASGTGSGGSSTGSGGTGDGTSGSGGSSSGGEPVAETCAEPELWRTPSTTRTVGDGTAASCTEQALRDAVTGGGHVVFDCGPDPVTIGLRAAVAIASETVIDGAGSVTLDGGGATRILEVSSGAALSVRNLRFIRGKSQSTMEPEGIGGAVAGNWRSRVEVYACTFEDNEAARGGGAVSVWTGSELVIIGSRFFGNRSWYGGAVYSLLSPLTIVNSEFVDNEAFKEVEGTEGEGGAIGTDGASEYPDDAEGGTIAICGSVIRSNRGRASGGGAYIWTYPPDVVTIERTTVEDNLVAATTDGGSLGGGMRVSNGEITIRDSSLLSNHAESHGGGLYLDCAPTCTIVNTTLYGNEALSTTGRDGGYGGAIFGSGLQLNNVTLAGNFAGGHGGGIFGGDFVVNNSLFVDNDTGNPWGQARSCSETGTGSHVLQWLSASGDGGSDRCVPDVLVADPLLPAAPADHGGPTPTLVPGPASAALQAGSGCEASDQRGQPRDPSACDLGAVELP